MALIHMPVAPWKSKLAIALLKARRMESEIPCKCGADGQINMFCPKHFALVAEKAPQLPIPTPAKKNERRPEAVTA